MHPMMAVHRCGGAYHNSTAHPWTLINQQCITPNQSQTLGEDNGQEKKVSESDEWPHERKETRCATDMDEGRSSRAKETFESENSGSENLSSDEAYSRRTAAAGAQAWPRLGSSAVTRVLISQSSARRRSSARQCTERRQVSHRFRSRAAPARRCGMSDNQ